MSAITPAIWGLSPRQARIERDSARVSGVMEPSTEKDRF